MAQTLSLQQLRRYALARSLFAPTTLPRALAKLGFVQADPIRAPARAQDLTLRHRVAGYQAGDLERRYTSLRVEEDFFVNYGFVTPAVHALMHPRTPRTAWTATQTKQAQSVLAFVQSHGVVHPRDVAAEFAHGRASNWFGGTSNASTQLLDALHYRGQLRIAGRDSGTRLYAVRKAIPPSGDPLTAFNALLDVVVAKYAPLPEASLGQLLSHLARGGVPQWQGLRGLVLQQARHRLASAHVDGQTWYWPATENPSAKQWQSWHESEAAQTVRLLAPFDPIVWDRRRFELFWGWAYRFEAYTPPAKRVRGYYALPLLWRDEVIGWANLKVVDGCLQSDLGYVSGKTPRGVGFKTALANELHGVAVFLELNN